MKEFNPRIKSVGIKEVKRGPKVISESFDWNGFWNLSKVMGFRGALRYKLGIAQEGVDYWY